MDHFKTDLMNDSHSLLDLLEGYFSQTGERVISPSEQAGIVLVLQQIREKWNTIESRG